MDLAVHDVGGLGEKGVPVWYGGGVQLRQGEQGACKIVVITGNAVCQFGAQRRPSGEMGNDGDAESGVAVRALSRGGRLPETPCLPPLSAEAQSRIEIVRGDLSDAATLAAGGFAVAAMDYSLPPKAIYPTPVRQAFEAFAYLKREAARLHVDPVRLFIAGDSAGAQIAAQVAAVATSPAYARRMGVKPTIAARELRGALLYSGAYDLATMGFSGPITSKLGGPLAHYAGTRTFRADKKFATFSVARYVTPAFPPTFVTAGNDDDFEDQSRAFAARLRKLGVRVDDMFFDADFTPRQGHVYVFATDRSMARYSAMRSVDFMKKTLGWK